MIYVFCSILLQLIASQDLPVKWLLDNLTAGEGNKEYLEQVHMKAKSEMIAATKKRSATDSIVSNMNDILNNPNATSGGSGQPHTSSIISGGGGDSSILGSEEDDILPRINLPQLGSPIRPIEFHSEKYNGTILLGLTSLPPIPVITRNNQETPTTSSLQVNNQEELCNYEVANMGNFSCAILP